MTVRLGISPIGWTNDAILDLGADIPLATCLSDAARAGFAGVEIGRKFPETPREIRAELSAYGLTPISAWYSGYLAERELTAEWPEAEAHAQKLISLGCAVMVYGECAAAPPDDARAPLAQRPDTLDLDTYAPRLTNLAERLAAMGIQLVYHHHMMQPVETASQIEALMQATGPSVRLLLDTGHLALAGEDYTAVMQRWWHRIGHIHLKDIRQSVVSALDRSTTSFNDGVRLGMFTVPGDGDLNFEPLMRQIADHGYDGWLVVEAEQDPERAPPAEMARKGFDHIRTLLDAVGLSYERKTQHG